MQLTHEEKLSLLNELIRLADADGKHRDEEYDMLHLVAESLQVEPMEMERLFLDSRNFTPPKEEARRIIVFYHMLRMVWADGVFDPNEEVLLRQLGRQLGHRQQAVDTLIERSRIFNNGDIPVEEVIHIFQVHHN